MPIVALAAVSLLLYRPADIGYDAAYAVAWGHQLLHLQAPDLGLRYAPTPHPLSYVVGAAASLTGHGAYGVMFAITLVAFGCLGLMAFRVGARSFDALTGIAFAAILLTRPVLVAEMLQSSVDIPFLALVLGALAVELRKHRPEVVLGLLAAAGLLRPEGWVLSIAYGAWWLPSTPSPQRPRVIALALLAPVIWCGADLLLTGDPFHSLHQTQSLAVDFGRPLGVGTAISSIPQNLELLIGGTVVWCGLFSAAIAILVLHERSRLFALLLLAGAAMFVVLGIFQLPLVARYLLLPGTIISLFAAVALFAWRLLPAASTARRLAAVGALAVAIALVASIPSTRMGIDEYLAEGSQQQRLENDLLSLSKLAVREGWSIRCVSVEVPTYRAVPTLSYWLGKRPSALSIVAPAAVSSGLLLSAPESTLQNDGSKIPGTDQSPKALRIPAGFHVIGSNDSWTLAERC